MDLSFKLTVLLGLFLFGMLASVGDVAVRWIFPNYIPGITLMILMSFVFIWMSLGSNVFGPLFNAYSRLDFLFNVKLFIAIANIIGNLILIPKFGIYGAFYATAGTVIFNTIICGWKGLTLVEIQSPMKNVMKSIIAMTVSALISFTFVRFMTLFTDFPVFLVIILALMLYVPVFIILFSKVLRGFEDMDKQLIKVLIKALPFSERILNILK